MPGSTRIKGAALSLTFGGIDQQADITSVTLNNEEADSDVQTFADVAAGGARTYFLEGTAVTSTQTGSFWRTTWANQGQIVAYRYAPHGNAVATADEPHFTGTVKIGSKPAIGGDAGSTQTFEFRFDCQEDPTLDVGSSAAGAITSVLPSGKAVGQQVVISGTRFTGATDVKFAAVSATSISVISDTTIVATIPAGTGVKAVTVITPAGTSPSVNYTVV